MLKLAAKHAHKVQQVVDYELLGDCWFLNLWNDMSFVCIKGALCEIDAEMVLHIL